ncbi:Volume-regulated anion channel subunit [Chlorella vulgaris]
MASRNLEEEERSGRQARSSGINRAPTRAAAAGALAVLTTPGLPLSTIFGTLEQDDKMRLGSTCTSLRQASQAWFPEVTVQVVPGNTNVASLAAWLERHQACLHVFDEDEDNVIDAGQASEAEWSESLAAFPTSLVTSLVTHNRVLSAAVSTLTALTRLEFSPDDEEEIDDLPFSASARYLRPLTRLRQLTLRERNVGCNAEELLSLPAGLQTLELRICNLKRLPRALSALTQLTALDLFNNPLLATSPLATLQRLQRLDLSYCSLTTVPEQLSVLTALTRLVLSVNKLESGWQHLLRLTSLQGLYLSYNSLTAVPEQVAALTALTCLDMSGNEALASGWQHLLSLPQLYDLNFEYCGSTAVPRQLSALTALTRLSLSSFRLNSGWRLPAQLQDLKLSGCDLAAVPEQLSALMALTSLDLRYNMQLDGGWQHLLPLTQLLHLNLQGVQLPNQEAPPELAALPQLHVVWRHYAICVTIGGGQPAAATQAQQQPQAEEVQAGFGQLPTLLADMLFEQQADLEKYRGSRCGTGLRRCASECVAQDQVLEHRMVKPVVINQLQ